MTAEQLLNTIICVSFFLFAFIAIVNPNKVNIMANRWLGIFFLNVGLKIAAAVVDGDHAAHQFDWLLRFVDLSHCATPALFYLSVVQFATPGKFNRKYYLSFVPGAIVFLLILPFNLLPAFKGYPFPKLVLNTIIYTIFLTSNLQMWVLWALAWYKLYKHQKNIQLVASNTTPVDLRWLNYLLYIIGIMMLIFVANNLLMIHSQSLYRQIIYLFCSLVICYYLIAQKEIFPYQPAAIAEVSQVIEEFQHQPKQIKPRMDDKLSHRLKLRLEHLMVHDKLYLDSELNLPQLAQSMEVSVHDLSYLLNDSVGMNFFQFINAYRVKEAKLLMLSDQHKHLNILGIAYSAGFSSKTTFNTAFKKQTGLSPSQFMKQGEIAANVSYQAW
ncbi:helix-turn-helix domain-containing protein [Mucilaginibacter jinjuensis]|uniref:Helix-turn-helix domain-containing protein n=1 Tax=Mucilaginibacter jinjuensis TaxID=1176721 RepID=A0ABY7T981_9SPHI|nr:helix-turn-helix domain-containing protein [Mucilaginibacter jinjuensis]WCT13040.1 helix-turn-helix domain-containing protein [Mucilaginibacter jinjuensis]